MKKLIRDTVQTALAALAEFKTVKIGRRHRLAADQLPAVLIYTDEEKIEMLCFSPIKYNREVKLVVRLYVKPDTISGGEDKADELTALVDPLIRAAVAGVEGLFDIQPSTVEFDGDGAADADYLAADLTYAVVFHASA